MSVPMRVGLAAATLCAVWLCIRAGAQGAPIAGRVVDEQGRGIAGARVILAISHWQGAQSTDEPPRETTSGADGAFAFPGTQRSAKKQLVRLFAVRKGFGAGGTYPRPEMASIEPRLPA